MRNLRVFARLLDADKAIALRDGRHTSGATTCERINVG